MTKKEKKALKEGAKRVTWALVEGALFAIAGMITGKYIPIKK